MRSAQRHGLPLINIFTPRRRAQRQRAAALSRPRPLRGAQARGRRARGLGSHRAHRAAQAHGAARRSQRRGARAAISPTSGSCDIEPLAAPGASRPSRSGRIALRARELGQAPTTSGCATSRTGASAASCGGAIASRPGTTTSGRCYVARSEAEVRAQHARSAAESRCARTRTCSTPGSPRRSGRSRRWAGRERHRRARDASTRPRCWSPASTSSSSGSPA